MPSLAVCIGWLFLIVAPVTFFDRLLSFSIINWIYGTLAAAGSIFIGFIILAIANSGPTTQQVTYYAYWCIAAAALIVAVKIARGFGMGARSTEN